MGRTRLLALGLITALAAGCDDDPPDYVVELGEHRFLTEDDPRFASPDFDDTNWSVVALPATWRVRTVDATVVGWHRFHFELPEVAPTTRLGLDLGAIGWSDEVFLNGQRIGATGRMDGLPRLGLRPRVYPVPVLALRTGDNVLAIRVRGIALGVAGLFQPRIGLGDELDLERALASSRSKSQLAEGLLFGFLGFAWLLVVFFPKRDRAGRATQFLLGTITMALVMLWLLSATFRRIGLSPAVGANVVLAVISLAAASYYGFVAVLARGLLPTLVKVLIAIEVAQALLLLAWPGGLAALIATGTVLGTVGTIVLGWLLVGAARARTPGAIPIAVGCVVSVVSLVGMAVLPSPFLAGLPLLYYGLASSIAFALLALTLHLHAKDRRMQRTTEYSLEAHRRERGRLARDLHDGLGQMLALLKMQMQRMGLKHRGDPVQEIFDESAEQVGATIDELRRIARDLRPAPMQDRGFGEAVREYAAAVNQRTDVSVDVEGDYADPPDEDVGDELYRIVQECVTNCLKHSGAHRIVVTLSEVDDRLTLIVVDDGRGLSPESPVGLGLATIRERSELLGGRCTITTAPDGGTRVEVSVPRST